MSNSKKIIDNFEPIIGLEKKSSRGCIVTIDTYTHGEEKEKVVGIRWNVNNECTKHSKMYNVGVPFNTDLKPVWFIFGLAEKELIIEMLNKLDS